MDWRYIAACVIIVGAILLVWLVAVLAPTVDDGDLTDEED